MEDWRRVPEVATPRAVGAAFGVFYVAGGVAALLVAAMAGASTTAPSSGAVVLLALGLGAVLVGLVVAALRERLGRRGAHLLAATATVLISIAVAAAPDGRSALVVAAVYAFVAVDTGMLFARLHALGHLAASLVAATAVLAQRHDVGVVHALALDVVLVAIAVVVGGLAQRASSASVDAMTDLPNRRGLDDAVDRMVRVSERTGSPLSVALLDLDGFKSVNDAGGHQAGDDLLRLTAARWRASLPEHALLARVGGDEFAVLLGAPAPELALVLAPLVRDPACPASAGVAEWVRPESPADALRRADVALYKAKRDGRGRCEVATRDLAERALAADLRTAVRTGGLSVAYQPVVRADDPAAAPVGVEALARWTHPVRGVVPPDVFVPLAESEGFVTELGAAVLERACRELAGVPGARERSLVLAVNVSGLELVEPGYVDRLSDVLRSTGWPAELLVLEVTESVVEGDAAGAVATLEAAGALGVRVAVDDFGTGYSALSRLDQLSAAYLKLDATFTATVHTSRRRSQLVRAVAAMSSTLGLGVVAEGVETADQARVLADLGCEYLQGYHVGRPEPLASLAARLERTQPAPAAAALPAPRRAPAGAAAGAPAGPRDPAGSRHPRTAV